MPSLNGYWIFNNHFTTQQWDDIQQYFTGLYMNFKFYLGNYGGAESDNWSAQYEYFNYSDGIYYDGADSVHACYTIPNPEISGYYGNWIDSNLTYGPNARLINIIDDDGLGEDESFYSFWTSIASKIEYPMNNTKWLFNNTLYNKVDYAANDENVYFTETIRSGDKMYEDITFDTYHASLWEMFYGNTSVYTSSNGWVNNTYKTISLYNIPSIPSYDEWTDVTQVLDALALIGGNATYQGEADPKLYKLGWRINSNS